MGDDLLTLIGRGGASCGTCGAQFGALPGPGSDQIWSVLHQSEVALEVAAALEKQAPEEATRHCAALEKQAPEEALLAVPRGRGTRL